MSTTGTLFSEWRVADRQASNLERELTRAWLRALEGRGEPPSDKDRDTARRLRETADDLFQLSMGEFAARARALGTDRGSQASLF
jgi:hypothetical protein